MKLFWLTLGALIAIAVAIVVFTRVDPHRGWRQPKPGLIKSTGGNLAFIEGDDCRIALVIPAECDQQTMRYDSNGNLRTFDIDVDYFAADRSQKVNVRYNSDDLDTIWINDRVFDVSCGAVFRVSAADAAIKRYPITQLPFRPIEPSVHGHLLLDKLLRQFEEEAKTEREVEKE